MDEPNSLGPAGNAAAPASGAPVGAPTADPGHPPGSSDPSSSHRHGHIPQEPPHNAASLDELVTTTTTGGWIVVAAVMASMVVSLIWALTAVLPQQITDPAVVSSPAGGFLVTAPAAGSAEVLVGVGQQVVAGEALAVIRPFRDGPPVSVTSPHDAEVSGVEVASGSGVRPGDPLLRLQRSAEFGVTSAVTFLEQSRIALYDADSTITATFTDIVTGQEFTIPASVVMKSNTPASVEEIRAVVPSTGEDAAGKVAAKTPLYRLDLRLDVESVPIGQRTQVGQLLTLTNVYSNPRPIDLLFGNAG